MRLLVVDDSVTARAVFSRIVAGEPDMEIAALASTAEEALQILKTDRFDVILLDLQMPGRGGLDALPEMIDISRGARILVVSTLTIQGAEETLSALQLGAADTLAKPQPGSFDQTYRDRLVDKIRELGRTALRAAAPARERTPTIAPVRPTSRQPAHVLAIGASTGGIHAIGTLFAALPRKLDIPILVTQHLPSSFMEAFARQLQNASGRPAVVAEEGKILQSDQILIAPGHAHMTILAKRGHFVVKLEQYPVKSGCTPSVDPMFSSLAQAMGAHALGVVLSGMGKDGTEGAKAIVDAGGTIFAQDEASCAVWGMPGSVAVAGLAASILSPDQIAGRVAACAKAK
jgi:two-component system chemotaxis response regulator CheB